METTFHKHSKAEKWASSQWHDICSLQNSLGALEGKILFKGYILISTAVREVFGVCKDA